MSNFLSLLFKYRPDGFHRYFRANKIAKIITIFVGCGILFAVAAGIYAFFHWEFSLIAGDAYLHVALPLYFYEGLLLIVFFLIFLSSFVSGMFALFRGRRDAFVIASPQFTLVFWKTYLRTLLSSIWPIVIIMMPAFLGSNSVEPMSLLGATLFFLSIIFLAVLGVAAAFALFIVEAAILAIVARLTSWPKLFSFGSTAAFGVITVIAVMAYAWHRVGIGDITAIFAPTDGSWSTSSLAGILSRFSVFPSHLAALTYLNAQMGSLGAAAVTTLGLAVTAAMSIVGLWLLSLIYLPLWQHFQEGNGENSVRYPFFTSWFFKKGSLGKEKRVPDTVFPITFPRYFKSPLGALFEKEGLILFREMKSALWFFFLFALWMIQVILEFFIRQNLIEHGANVSSIAGQIESLQLGTAIYFIAAFILRFVFPSFSGEQKTAWIIGVSPLKMQSIFWSKFFFYAVLFLALGVVFCGLNFAIIQLAIAQSLAFIGFVFLMIIFLVSFGLGLGAIFPNFETDDPEILSTSLPGLGFIFGSLLYGGYGTYLFYQFVINPAGGSGVPLIAFSAITVALILFVISLSLSSLQKFEFVADAE